MILPFPQEKKAIWNLKDNSERINNAINETHPSILNKKYVIFTLDSQNWPVDAEAGACQYWDKRI